MDNTTKIFVNLPVKDLNKSIEFFTALGLKTNPKFTDTNAGCIIINDHIYAMLLTEPFFKGFTKKEIADLSSVNEAIIALSVESREAVDAFLEKAFAAGAKKAYDKTDLGFMYGWSFQDPDGHIWEIFWMDEAAAQ